MRGNTVNGLEARILLIGSDKELQNHLEESLVEYHFDSAALGKEGIEKAKQKIYSMVLLLSRPPDPKESLDMLLEISGVNLESADASPSIPVTVLSDYSDHDEFRIEAFLRGAYEVLPLPLQSPDDLLSVINDIESIDKKKGFPTVITTLEKQFGLSLLDKSAHQHKWYSGEAGIQISYSVALRRVLLNELNERKRYVTNLLKSQKHVSLRQLEVQYIRNSSPDTALNLAISYIEHREFKKAADLLKKLALLPHSGSDSRRIALDASYELARLLLHNPSMRFDVETYASVPKTSQCTSETSSIGQAPSTGTNIFSRIASSIRDIWNSLFSSNNSVSSVDKLKAEYTLANLGIINGNLEEAINSLEKILKDDPSYMEVYFTLAGAYIQAGRKPEAYSLFSKSISLAVGHDPIEGHKSDSAVIRQTQLMGMHDVFETIARGHSSAPIVLKVFRRQEIYEAKTEYNNLLWLNDHKVVLSTGEQIMTPREPIELLVNGPDSDAYLIMGNMPGTRLSKRIRNLDREEQIKYFKFLVDAASSFQVKGREMDGLEDVRKKEYARRLKGDNRPIGFYTHRFFTKLIDALINYREAVFEKKAQARLRGFHDPIQKALANAPEFMQLWYCDCNLRNFLIHYTGTKGAAADVSDILINSRKTFLDFPSKDVRLGLLDILAAIEMDHSIKLEQEDVRYLSHLWGVYVIRKIAGEPTESLDLLTAGEIRKIFARELKETAPRFNIDDFERLRSIASFQKHAETLGDRLREVALYDEKLAEYREKYGKIPAIYEFMNRPKSEQARIAQQIRDFPEEERSADYELLSDFIQICREREFLKNDVNYHKRMIMRRLTEVDYRTEFNRLRESLNYRFRKSLKHGT